MNPTTHTLRSVLWYIGIVVIVVALVVAALARTAAAATSVRVAYVTDSGTGSRDTLTPPATDSLNIFDNALTGVLPGDSYTTADGAKTVKIIDVAVSDLDNPAMNLASFDTMMLYQVCEIGSNAMTAINSFLLTGGKVLIFDAARCAANYATFIFPVTTSGPAAAGSDGAYSVRNPVSSLATRTISPRSTATGAARLPARRPEVGPASCRRTRGRRTAVS